jgi:hypothetical protein
MTYDLTRFDLGAMLKCSLQLREVSNGNPTLESAAQRVCRFLYDELRTPEGARACALVRCYKTHPFADLSPDLQQFARGALGAEEPRPDLKCLTLFASVGQNAGWNSRHLSQGHKVIPLASPEMVQKAPMISQLIKELGLELTTVLQPSPEIVKELAGKQHGVFHVEHAPGSPYIPAQQEFVVKHGIESVLGFGGMLPSGDLFAVILFSVVHVPASVAERFKALALDVKSGFAKFRATNVFERVRSPGFFELRPQS